MSAEVLVERLGEGLAWKLRENDSDKYVWHTCGPVRKPHGRLAWTIPYMSDWQIDLSVTPRSNERK